MSKPLFVAGTLTRKRRRADKIFQNLTYFSAGLGIFLLLFLIYGLLKDGLPGLTPTLLTNLDSRFPSRAGIKAALLGTLWVIGLTTIITVPVGVAAAIYLEEFSKKNKVAAFIQINIANLASVPSIIYALLGLALFVRLMDLGRSIISGSLTMSLLIMPMVIITTQEALRAVPQSLREASLALGATPWKTVVKQVLPAARPGILTGIILSVSRAIGETAPIITIGAVFVSFLPKSASDTFTTLPVLIFNWSGHAKDEFRALAASAIIVLMATLLTLNLCAILLRNKYRKQTR